jgi:hypothetical protein
MWGRNGSADKQYLNPNRLADVLALIQVLALDEHVHRSEDGLQSELQGQPKSGRSWTEIARSHPEFFRVRPQGDHKRSERWTYLVPIWVALITGLFVLGAVALKGAFGQN